MPVATPTNVKIRLDGTTYPDSTAVVVSWDAGSDQNVHSFLVQRSDDGGSTYSSGAFVAKGYAFVEADPLTSGTTYYYKVSAVAHEGNSAPSDPAPVVYIDSPAYLTVALTDPPSPLAFDLTWGPVTGADTFRIERTPSQSNALGLLTTGQVAPPFTDNIGTVIGNEYTYAIRAENSFGVTRRRISLPAPLPPAFIAAITPGDPTSITLTWDTTNYVDVSHFDISRSTDGGTTFNDSFASNVTGSTRADAGLTPGATYIYRIRARSDTGFVSAWSDPIQAQLVGTITSITITPAFGNAILLNWGAPTGATTYIVERKDGSAGWAVIVPFLGLPSFSTAPQFLDSAYTFLKPGQDYTYRIYPGNTTAYRDPTQSAWTATAPEQFVGDVGVPNILDRVPVNLSWKLATYTGGNVTGLLIEKSTNDGTTWFTVHTVAITDTSYNDDTIAEDSTVLYRISAVLSAPDVSSFPVVIAVTSVGASCTEPLTLLAGAQVRGMSLTGSGGQKLPVQTGVIILNGNDNLVGGMSSDNPQFLRRRGEENGIAANNGPVIVDPNTGVPIISGDQLLEQGILPRIAAERFSHSYVVPDRDGGNINLGAKSYYRGPSDSQPLREGVDFSVGDLVIVQTRFSGVKAIRVGPGTILGVVDIATLVLPQLVFISKSISSANNPNTALDYFGGCKGFPFKIPDGTKWANQPWYIVRKQETWDYSVTQAAIPGPLSPTPDRTEYLYYYMGLVSEGGVINPAAGKHLAVDTLKTNTAFNEGFGFDRGYRAVRLSYYPLVTCHGSPQVQGVFLWKPNDAFTAFRVGQENLEGSLNTSFGGGSFVAAGLPPRDVLTRPGYCSSTPAGGLLVSAVIADALAGNVFIARFAPNGSYDASWGSGGVVSYSATADADARVPTGLRFWPDGSGKVTADVGVFVDEFSAYMHWVTWDASGNLLSDVTVPAGNPVGTPPLTPAYTFQASATLLVTDGKQFVAQVQGTDGHYYLTLHEVSGYLFSSIDLGTAVQASASLLGLPDGGFLYAYNDRGTAANAVVLKRYDASGTETWSSSQTATGISSGSFNNTDLSALGDGSFILGAFDNTSNQVALWQFTSAGDLDTTFGTGGLTLVSVDGSFTGTQVPVMAVL